MVEKIEKCGQTMAKFLHAFSLQNPNSYLANKMEFLCSNLLFFNQPYQFHQETHKILMTKPNPQILGLWPKISRKQGRPKFGEPMVHKARLWCLEGKRKARWALGAKTAPNRFLGGPKPVLSLGVKPKPKPTGFWGKSLALIFPILRLNFRGNLSVLLLLNVWA